MSGRCDAVSGRSEAEVSVSRIQLAQFGLARQRSLQQLRDLLDVWFSFG